MGLLDVRVSIFAFAFAVAIVAVALVAAPASAIVVGGGLAPSAKAASPPFCRDLDCPPYNVLTSGDNWELRSYSAPRLWSATVVTDISFSHAVKQGFYRCADGRAAPLPGRSLEQTM